MGTVLVRSVVLVLLLAFSQASSVFGQEALPVEPRNIVNPKGISNFSRKEIVVLDAQSGDVLLVRKDNTELTRPLFRVTRGSPTTLQAVNVGGRDKDTHPWGKRSLGLPENGPDGPTNFKKVLFMGNATLRTIDLYSERGTYLRSFQGSVGYASDMAVAGEFLFVVDSEYQDIKVFRSPGALVATIAHPLLARPCNIALRDDVMYVSDNGDSRADIDAGVVLFDRHSYAYLGRLEGEAYGFDRPRGLAFDGNVLLLSETLLGKIIRIDLSDMQRLADLGEFGSLKGQLLLPKDIYFDRGKKTVYVINHRMGRIEALGSQ